MNRKRDRSPSLSPSGSGDESTKVCLICEAIPHEDVKSSYYVFVLDPAEASADAETDSFPNREPTLRIDGLGTVTFCVFKSTLYIFEFEFMSPVEKYDRDYHHRLYDLYQGSDKDIEVDYDIEAEYDMDVIARLCQRKSVYSFDLPDSLSEMIIVQKSDLHKLPDMHGVKVVAEAVVTPGGKILVFSTIITTDVYYYPHLIAPFELYDPDTKEWMKIPEVTQEFDEVDMSIWGAGFLSSSTFLISCGNGNFVFDLDKNGSGWKQHDLLPKKMEGFKFVGVAGGEGVCLTSSRLKNARDWTTLSMYPQNRSRFPRYLLDSLFDENIGFSPRLRGPLFCVVDTADADGCFNFCGARVLIFRDSKSCPACGARVLNFRDSKSCPASLPYFIFDVFRGRPGDELELSGSIKFYSNIGDFFDLKFWGLFRVCFNC